jgi:hypothetical protein
MSILNAIVVQYYYVSQYDRGYAWMYVENTEIQLYTDVSETTK